MNFRRRPRPTADEIFKWELENPDIAEWLHRSKISFAQSMKARLEESGSLTDNMVMAIRRIIEKENQSKPKQEAHSFDMAKLKAAMDKAFQNGLARPALSIDEFVITRAGDRSANPGALYVKHRDGTYLGKVTPGNLFVPIQGLATEISRRIVEIGKDPLTRAIEHGKRTGICSCCRRLLTNSESIEAGIGPICRSKFGW